MGAVAGSGAQPREIFFTILMDFEAKSTYHTTYRTLLESSHVQICACSERESYLKLSNPKRGYLNTYIYSVQSSRSAHVQA